MNYKQHLDQNRKHLYTLPITQDFVDALKANNVIEQSHASHICIMCNQTDYINAINYLVSIVMRGPKAKYDAFVRIIENQKPTYTQYVKR